MEAESSSQKPHMQMAATRISVSSCPSLLMAFLFALSASFQFNDPDWYLWFPLYAMACLVNMVNGVPKVTKTAKIALLMGIILFLKVVIEDVRFHQGITGLWSFDMRERVVREKLGSGLVILSMSLQLLKSDINNPSLANHVEFGQSMLVAIGYGLSVAFFLFSKPEMKF
ncbi:uncharacterized protein LOC107813525 [Nicotiana tabacum]|uniref:Uncharacterized protein LOC107813525 n=2 Tax=Nicotiana TaxID=4085 RepID=A0A1S4BZR2_TOBAC|nr:PREDICTED: uncharacterized protein LOC104226333 [Nicotiana sylvestris]XP_016494289.1 PREDICTED: uncharacterized protein LOC107813525 [Nicotiana tabacum]